MEAGEGDSSSPSALSKIDDVLDSVVEKLRKHNSAGRQADSQQLENGSHNKLRRNFPEAGDAQVCQLMVAANGPARPYSVQGVPIYYSTLAREQLPATQYQVDISDRATILQQAEPLESAQQSAASVGKKPSSVPNV